MLPDFSTDTTLSRRERERMARRQAMLDAARTVFAEKGYADATLDEIAQRAEFGKGTLYNYFKNKEELLLACFDALYDDMVALTQASFTQEAIEGRPMRDVFHAYVESILDFFMREKDVFALVMKEAQRMFFSEDEEKVAYFMKQRERFVDALIEPLEAAMERGEIKALPPHAVANMILGNISGLQMHLALEACCPDLDEDSVLGSARQAADFLTTMLFDGLSTHPADAPSS